jgi:hypothetical protein
MLDRLSASELAEIEAELSLQAQDHDAERRQAQAQERRIQSHPRMRPRR